MPHSGGRNHALPDQSHGRNQEHSVSLTRRELLTTGAVLGLGAAAVSAGVLSPFTTLAFAADTNPSPEDLAHAGPAGDIMIGSDKAPVTIIEYASMTCPHCAHFEEETLPELKKRCAGPEKSGSVVETLFAKQPDWVIQQPIPPLMAIAKQFGFTEESFNACLANQKVLDDIQAVRDHAVNKLQVNSTPTFFINGKRFVGDLSIDVMAKEIDPYLKEG